MAISASELVAYASANMPTDDESTSGGAIDDTIRVVFTPLAADDDIEVVSSSGSDTTQDVTVVARAPNGEVVTDTVTLNGTTPVGFEFGTSGEAIERVLSVTMDGDAAGTVTIRRGSGGATVGTIPAGERGFRRLFINAASDPDTQTERYEKIFLKNTNSTLALLNAE